MNQKAVSISPSQLIGFLDQELKELPDNRKGDNKKYAVKDAVIAAFSVFFTQSPFFLQHQRLMKPKKGQDNQVINFPPEFLKKQDGKTKQDCENVAVKRWLFKNPVERKNNQITLLGDDLYSRQPICELALEQGYNFIFVAKESSHKSLYEWLDFSERNGESISGEIKKYEKGKIRIYRYRYVNNVPIRESKPSLMVNWYEVEIFDNAKNKVIYQNSFITNHELNEQNLFTMMKSGRTRWKVENESNNILKNQGYNLEHNCGSRILKGIRGFHEYYRNSSDQRRESVLFYGQPLLSFVVRLSPG